MWPRGNESDCGVSSQRCLASLETIEFNVTFVLKRNSNTLKCTCNNKEILAIAVQMWTRLVST